jgi:hypothetical protein
MNLDQIGCAGIVAVDREEAETTENFDYAVK